MPKNWPKLVRYAAIAVAAVVVVFFLYQLYIYMRGVSVIPKSGTAVVFVERGIPEKYAVSAVKLKKTELETLADGSKIYESVPSPLKAGERLVLATTPVVGGMVFGVVDSGGALTILVSGETNKSDLSVRPDGIAVFASRKITEEAEKYEELPQNNDDDVAQGTEGKGSASGPVNLGVPFAIKPEVSISALLAVHLDSGRIVALGPGRSPRLLEDGSVLALALDGIVVVNPESTARMMVLVRQGADGYRGGISPSGAVVAIESSEAGGMDFYSFSKKQPYSIVSLGSLTYGGPVSSVAFADDGKFFLKTGANVARLFNVPTEKVGTAVPLAVMELSN